MALYIILKDRGLDCRVEILTSALLNILSLLDLILKMVAFGELIKENNMEFYTYSWTIADIQAHSNIIKELILNNLVKEGIISEQNAKDYLSGHTVIVYKKGC